MSIEEALGARTPLGSDLFEGVKAISLNQVVEFIRYVRVVLPIDGWVFWVRADLAAQAIFQTSGALTAQQVDRDESRKLTFTAKASLHYSAEVRQEEGENYAADRVVLTSSSELNDLNDIAPGTMWIGMFEGLRFAFSNLGMRYQQANLWHYSGFAVYPDMEPMVIDSITQFATAQVVNNSLPAWLALASYKPVYAFWSPPPILFPSFLQPLNEPPPFGSVHIVPETTKGLASAPTIDPKTSTHTQLCSETVRITLWGLRNDQALDFVDMVTQYSMDRGVIGLMNIPVPRDEKRTQSELGTLAIKKVIDFEVTYLQHRVNDIAQQIIRKAIPNFNIHN
jgi:hypothetical protein